MYFKTDYIILKCIYFKGRSRQRERERKREDSFIHWFIPQMPVTARPAQDKAHIQELHPGLPHLRHHSLPQGCISRKVGQKHRSQESNQHSDTGGVIPIHGLTHCTTLPIPDYVT